MRHRIMQARDSVTGQVHHWRQRSGLPLSDGYPGPNLGTQYAVISEHSEDDDVQELEDTFLGSSTTSGQIGDMHWRASSTMGTPSVSIQEIAGRLGVVRLTTGGDLGNDQRLYLTNTPNFGILDPEKLVRMRWVVRVPSGQDCGARVGLMSSLDALWPTAGDSGIWFAWDPGSNQWAVWSKLPGSSAVKRESGPSGDYENVWTRLELAVGQDGFYASWKGASDSPMLPVGPYPMPSGTPLAIGATVVTGINAPRSLDIDHFSLKALRTW
jgi:hypothetical protein